MSEEWNFLKTFGVIAIGITIIFCICAVVVISFKPTLLKFERKAYKESHQYVESKETQLLQLVDEYNELETEIAKYEADNDQEQYSTVIAGLEAQQGSLATRIKTEAERVPDEALPESVEVFVATH